MQITLSKTFLAAIMLSTLTACGSGGGSGGGNSASTTTSSAGAAYTIGLNDDGEITSIAHSMIKQHNANLDYLVIDGQKIALPRNIKSSITSQLAQLVNLDYADVGVSGLVTNGEDKVVLFYTGNPTKDMPSSGKATYRGDSFVMGTDLEDIYSTGKMTLTADFATKKLNGSLDFHDIQPINITANIQKENFLGTAESESLTGSGRVEGKFYGKDAATVAGIVKSHVFNDERGWLAGFSGADEKYFK